MDNGALTGYTDFEQRDGRTFATAHYESGATRRCEVRVAIDSQVTRAGGKIEPAREVASTDDGSVRIAAGASL